MMQELLYLKFLFSKFTMFSFCKIWSYMQKFKIVYLVAKYGKTVRSGIAIVKNLAIQRNVKSAAK